MNAEPTPDAHKLFGVAFQEQTLGSGFFPGTGESGKSDITPAP